MIKIIETNLFKDFSSFQSRVIEVESWEYVIKQFIGENKIPKIHTDVNGHYSGVIRPRFSKVKNLKYDGDKLMCDVEDFTHNMRKKLIERVG
jgi:hypothetical protein